MNIECFDDIMRANRFTKGGNMAAIRIRVPKYQYSRQTGRLHKVGFSTHYVHVPKRRQ